MRSFLVVLALVALSSAAGAQNLYGTPSMGVASTGAVSLPVSPVSKLPACNLTHQGIFFAVNDAVSPTYGSIIAGGGSIGTPVFCDGKNWTAR